jgi:hypothetical protein
VRQFRRSCSLMTSQSVRPYAMHGSPLRTSRTTPRLTTPHLPLDGTRGAGTAGPINARAVRSLLPSQIGQDCYQGYDELCSSSPL